MPNWAENIHGHIFLQLLKYEPMHIGKTVSKFTNLLISVITPTPY